MRLNSFLTFVLLSLVGIQCSHAPHWSEKETRPDSCHLNEPVDQKKLNVVKDRLLEAVLESDAEKVKKLIDQGVNVQTKDQLGLSYLHFAAGTGNEEVMKLLLDAGISVNQVGGQSKTTPSHSAVLWGSLPSLRFLAQHGADLNRKNALGKTPKDLAIELKRSDMIEFFKSHPTF